jgi:hypothetical protein
MGLNTRFGKVADATNSAATDTLTANAPAGGTGATAGAYDSAANRDLMIATINGLNATVASMLVTQNAMRVDMAAMLVKLNAGE